MRVGTVLRLAGYGCAAALLYVGAGSFREGVRHARAYEAAQRAIRVCMPIDLLTTGEYRGVLRETFLGGHGSAIEIKLMPPFDGKEEADKALAGLEGTMRIRAADGAVVEEKELGKCLYCLERGYADGRYECLLMLCHQAHERGEFELAVNVTSPAAGMAGRSQEVVGTYQLCGLEKMPAMIGYFSGGCVTLVGLTVAAVSWRWGRRKK